MKGTYSYLKGLLITSLEFDRVNLFKRDDLSIEGTNATYSTKYINNNK